MTFTIKFCIVFEDAKTTIDIATERREIWPSIESALETGNGEMYFSKKSIIYRSIEHCGDKTVPAMHQCAAGSDLEIIYTNPILSTMVVPQKFV